MPKAILTDAAVRKLKPGSTRKEIPDAGAQGLHLVIQPGGKKSWAMRFRGPDRKSAKLTIGPADLTGRKSVENPEMSGPLTLAEARLIAATINHQRASGADVIAERKATKLRARLKIADDRNNSYPAVLRQYVDRHAKPKTRRWRHTVRLLGLSYATDGVGPETIRGGLADRWADRPVRSIGPADIYAVVDESVRLGVPGLRRRREARTEPLGIALHSALSGFFGWLQRHQRVDLNVCAHVHRPPASGARERVLRDDELVSVWNASDALGQPYAPLLKLLMLTGARLREAADMRWDELTEDFSVWSLPGSRVKNKRPLILPLPPHAREVLKSVKPVAGPFVFTFSGSRPVNNDSRMKRRLDQASGVTSWTLHDIRRSVATGLQKLGVRLEVTEAVLNHVAGSRAGIVGVYQRHEYADEKRAALERWADHVDGLIHGRASNVVSLPALRESAIGA
jgi:integrase